MAVLSTFLEDEGVNLEDLIWSFNTSIESHLYYL